MRKTILMIALLLLVGHIEPSSARAFQSVSSVICHHANCQVRLGDSGRLYIFQHLSGSQSLYISDPRVSQYDVYDLTDKDLGGVDLVDFVPLEAQNLIVFYTFWGATTRAIKIYDLSTQALQTVDLSDAGDLVQCNYWTRLNFVPPNFISHLGTESEIVFCSMDSATHKIRINILDALTQTVTQTIDMDSFMTLVGGDQPPWGTLVAGRDGNIYIGANTPPKPPILDTVLTDAGGVLPDHWVTFRFAPQTGIWSVDQMLRAYTDRPGNSSVGGFEGVDAQGRYVFYLSWSEANGPRHTEVIRYDPVLEQIAQVTSSDIGGSRIFASMNAASEVVLVTVVGEQGELSPLIVSMDDYIIPPLLTDEPETTPDTP